MSLKKCARAITIGNNKLLVYILREPLPIRGGVLAVFRAPSRLIYSVSHAAKAAEEALEAISLGRSLRDRNLEFLRRLTARKQVVEIQELLSRLGGDRMCAVVVSAKEMREGRCCRPWGVRAADILFPKIRAQQGRERLEEAVLATVAMTSTGKWYK